jgi:hypothetical protein
MKQSTQQPRCADTRSEGAGNAAKTGDQIEMRRAGGYVTDTLLKRVLRMIFPDQRKDGRLLIPPLVGYLGTMRASKPYPLADISVSGFCMLTEEHWTPGTEMPITLQRMKPSGNADAECFTVQATVVRRGNDGVGFSILLDEEDSNAADGNPLRVSWINKQELQQFLNRLNEPEELKAADTEQPESLLGAGEAVQSGAALKPAFLGNQL